MFLSSKVAYAYLTIQLIINTPLLIFVFERFEFQPLKSRSKSFTISFFIGLQLFLLISIYSSTATGMNEPCYFFFVVNNSILLLLIHCISFRAMALYINYLVNNEAAKEDISGEKKWYVVYNPDRKPTVFYSVFAITYVALGAYLWVQFIVKDTISEPLYVCYADLKEMYYVYSFIALESIVLIFMAYKIYRFNDSLQMKKEFLAIGVMTDATLALYILFRELKLDEIYSVTVIFIALMGISGTMTVWPIYNSFIEENIQIANKKAAMPPRSRLESLWEDAVLKAEFKVHLLKEFSVENMLFCDAVDSMRVRWENFSEEQRKNTVDFIWNRYVDTNADYQINIGSKVYHKVKNNRENHSVDIFDPAYDEIFDLMSIDSLPRFEAVMKNN